MSKIITVEHEDDNGTVNFDLECILLMNERYSMLTVCSCFYRSYPSSWHVDLRLSAWQKCSILMTVLISINKITESTGVCGCCMLRT